MVSGAGKYFSTWACQRKRLLFYFYWMFCELLNFMWLFMRAGNWTQKLSSPVFPCNKIYKWWWLREFPTPKGSPPGEVGIYLSNVICNTMYWGQLRVNYHFQAHFVQQFALYLSCTLKFYKLLVGSSYSLQWEYKLFSRYIHLLRT